MELSRFVLWVTGLTIAALIFVLLWLGQSVGDDVTKIYAQVLNPSRIGSEFYMLGRIEQLIGDLSVAANDPAWQMSSPSATNETAVLDFIQRLPSVTAEQKTNLHRCNPLPEDASQLDLLRQCLLVLKDIRQAALDAAASVSDAEIATASADKLLAHRQSFFTFWIQAAQLILLNLLLPLLTALFGYIFGTQQANASGER